ncbi:hypothetical protein IHE61_14345 [Streptomyces sp. GKU 257-1]|nr:hypothetical protein [Streptomyces sp. GKU 257-1]
MAKNKNRQPARESRTAEEQQRGSGSARSRPPRSGRPPPGAARKGRERRFGHN